MTNRKALGLASLVYATAMAGVAQGQGVAPHGLLLAPPRPFFASTPLLTTPSAAPAPAATPAPTPAPAQPTPMPPAASATPENATAAPTAATTAAPAAEASAPTVAPPLPPPPVPATGASSASAAGTTAAAASSASASASVSASTTTAAPFFPSYLDPKKGVHTHDGFFLRLAWGANYTQANSNDAGGSLRVNGPGAELSVAVGGALGKGLVLFADMFFSYMFSGSIHGDSSGSIRPNDLGVSFFAIGPGLAYYIMPANVFFSVSAGIPAVFVVRLGDGSDDLGARSVIGNFSVGKEWWVSDQWGFGLSGRCNLGTGQFGDDTRWRMFSLGLAVSVTYN